MGNITVHVTIGFLVSIAIIAVTIYQLNVDPRVPAMASCTRGIPDFERQIECARIIFGVEE